MNEEEIEFLKESNAIEGEYSEEAMEDAVEAWEYAKVMLPIGRRMDGEFIRTVHQFLMKRLDSKIAGKFREVDVYVGNITNYKKCLDWKKIQEELRLLCNPAFGPLFSEDLIKSWHIQFEKIHPFEDGNGRVGRILMNIQRLQLGVPILIIHEGKEQMEYYKWFKEGEKKKE